MTIQGIKWINEKIDIEIKKLDKLDKEYRINRAHLYFNPTSELYKKKDNILEIQKQQQQQLVFDLHELYKKIK